MHKTFKNLMTMLILCVIVLVPSACGATKEAPDKTGTVNATVIEIEKYGHAVLDITTSDFTNHGYTFGDIVCVRFDSQTFDMPFFDGYYSTPGTEMLRGVSAEENIAICINYGDFSNETGIAPGDTVEITMVEKAGMLTFYELSALKYSDNRADFSDDVTFANFRAVTAGTIGNGKLSKVSLVTTSILKVRFSMYFSISFLRFER